MKFNKCPFEKGKIVMPRSPQRVAAAARAIKRDKEEVALFPEMVKFNTVEERISSLDQHRTKYHREHRERTAKSWREARRALYDLPAISRAGILRWWNDPSVWIPRDPVYLLTAIRDVKVYHASYWRRLRIKKQFELIRDGRLPKSVIQSIRAWDLPVYRSQLFRS